MIDRSSQKNPDVTAAVRGVRRSGEGEALGVIETRTVAAIIQAADAGVKGAKVILQEIRLADGLGGRDYDESTARVSLTMGDLGGRDYDVRIRLRSREINRGPDAGSEQSG